MARHQIKLNKYIKEPIRTLPNSLSDYMVRFNLTEVPLLFIPLTNSIVAFTLALIILGILAAILGWFIFSERYFVNSYIFKNICAYILCCIVNNYDISI